MTSQQIINQLKPVFEQYADTLATVYLFGSLATGNATARSDIDLAVLVKPSATSQADTLRFGLYRDLSLALGRNDIDLVMLNSSANLMLQDEIVRYGVVLYDGDGESRLDFELRTQHQAIDFRWQRQMAMGV